jgi:hypothetical protein
MELTHVNAEKRGSNAGHQGIFVAVESGCETELFEGAILTAGAPALLVSAWRLNHQRCAWASS